jgi:O-antigen biosynthesis protein WbqP
MEEKTVQRIVKRAIDASLALMLLLFLSPILLLVALAVKLDSRGPALYWSSRIGQFNQTFSMPKFRTMKVDTPVVATNLLAAEQYVTKLGKFLRKSSLDELPQLISILKQDMSFVGPRPALFNQYALIEQRDKLKINLYLPGLTGWAQINGRDLIEDDEKIQFDLFYVTNWSLFFDLKIMVLTALKVFKRENISH